MTTRPLIAALAFALTSALLASCSSTQGTAGQARIEIRLPPQTGAMHPLVRWAPLQPGTTVREATLAMWPEVFGAAGGGQEASYMRMIQSVEGNDSGTGWHYTVNGVAPSEGPQQYVLKDGDAVMWRYL